MTLYIAGEPYLVEFSGPGFRREIKFYTATLNQVKGYVNSSLKSSGKFTGATIHKIHQIYEVETIGTP